MTTQFKDLTGKNLGSWIVIKRAKSIGGHSLWDCICACGNKKTVYSHILISGGSKSCSSCHARKIGLEQPRKHGHCVGGPSKEYRTWCKMKLRCFNSKCKEYKRYGGRGITVCKRWMSFKNFIKDMGKAPNPKMSIDRINNDGDYKPSNCRWATDYQQKRNKSDNTVLKAYGQKLIITDWARKYKMTWSVFYRKFKKEGWPFSIAPP